MWRIDDTGAARVDQSSFAEEKTLEELVKKQPALLDEDALLIIGQQVVVADVNDKIDLLAIDTERRSVVIEIKREKVKDPAELQAIRYASYVSNWGRDSFEREADKFYEKPENSEVLSECFGIPNKTYEDFNQALEEFCDEGYELNHDQRIILVGTDIGEKVISVLAWLNKKGIDIRFVQLQVFSDEGRTYVTPRTVFPPPKQDEMLVGTSSRAESQPWTIDGKNWHLKSVCSESCGRLLMQIVEDLESLEDVEGVSWNQKFYVGVIVDGRRWMWINTYRNQLNISFIVQRNSLTDEEVIDSLELSREAITVQQKRSWDRFKVKIRTTGKYNSEQFLPIVERAIGAFRGNSEDSTDT
jgi:hypothetical protein